MGSETEEANHASIITDTSAHQSNLAFSIHVCPDSHYIQHVLTDGELFCNSNHLMLGRANEILVDYSASNVDDAAKKLDIQRNLKTVAAKIYTI